MWSVFDCFLWSCQIIYDVDFFSVPCYFRVKECCLILLTSVCLQSSLLLVSTSGRCS
uniref:Uncharacterized protein n=1 Tax=Anguilla anguilla TaxID=7936 RepID=A0A0E9SN64_ANGAN